MAKSKHTVEVEEPSKDNVIDAIGDLISHTYETGLASSITMTIGEHDVTLKVTRKKSKKK